MALNQANTTVIPAQAGIQPLRQWFHPLDSGLRRNDTMIQFTHLDIA